MDLRQRVTQVYEETTRTNEHQVFNYLKNPLIVRRSLDVFDLYKTYLEGKSRILDWGCRNAVTAYTIRAYLSNDVEIHGCDIEQEDDTLAKQAKLIYSPLEHPYKLPYADDYFDIAISNGVLEHVANDFESLKELYRVIKNDGYLIITFLPNQSSYTEFLARKVIRKGYHLRRYSLKEIKKMLLHSGFVPIDYGYHQIIPSLISLTCYGNQSEIKVVRFLIPLLNQIYNLNKYIEKLWPINQVASNIFVIAQKKSMI